MPAAVEACVTSNRWKGKINSRTGKPYTESEKWAICNWAHKRGRLSRSGTIVGGNTMPMDIGSQIILVKWSRAFINSLPNSSFAVIEPGYLAGVVDNKNARHLPFKDRNGKVDLPHLRNALARMNQITPVTRGIPAKELQARAVRKLMPYAKKHLPNSKWAKGEK